MAITDSHAAGFFSEPVPVVGSRSASHPPPVLERKVVTPAMEPGFFPKLRTCTLHQDGL